LKSVGSNSGEKLKINGNKATFPLSPLQIKYYPKTFNWNIINASSISEY
jgi:hypothetical protein